MTTAASRLFVILLFASAPLVSCKSVGLDKNMRPASRPADGYRRNIELHYANLSTEELDKLFDTKKKRDAFIFDMLYLADIYYEEFRDRFYYNTSVRETLFDFGSLAFSGAATVVTAQPATNILSGISTLIQGTQKSIDARFLQDQALESIINKMDENRAALRTSIFTSMTKSASAYSAHAAYYDILNYCKAGSLIEAVAQLAASTGEKKNAEEATAGRAKMLLDATEK